MPAERWRGHSNIVRPPSSLGYRPPAPAAWLTEHPKGMEKGKANNASYFSMPRLRRDSEPKRCAILIISLVQSVGQPKDSLTIGHIFGANTLITFPESGRLISIRAN